MSTFKTGNIGDFDQPTTFNSPEILGYISLGNNGVTFDKSKMRYLRRPSNPENVRYDLNEGYRDMEEEPEDKFENIDHIISWICKDEPGSDVKDVFVCRRYLLTTLLRTPYENNHKFDQYSHWTVAVIMYKGTFYMCRFDRNQPKEEIKEPEHSDWRKSLYWGLEFERRLTTSKSKEETQEDESRDENLDEGKFWTVNKLRTNNHSLVYSCETDAFDEENKAFVELKTSTPKIYPRNETIFKRYKLLQWWTQAQAGGVKEILCGIRDDEGIVTRLESFQTNDIPRIGLNWTPNVCYNFLDQLLGWMKEKMAETGDFTASRTVHIFEWSLKTREVSHCTTTEDRYKFLPESYLNSDKTIYKRH